ncbi:MAG: RNA 2',3'-cyclic phosphodiesterase [Deltaproteobacteria bacterium]|nr:RNA 2',3'-cyclic phosphodiesterase [Deltaproteobacteria bacterium]
MTTQPEKMMRTFLAIDIPKEITDSMEKIQYRLRNSLKEGMIRWTKPNSVHLTLKFFGSISDRDIEHITGLLKDSVKGFKPFELTAEKVGVFPNSRQPRVLWLGITGGDNSFMTLQKQIDDDLHGIGFPREERPFRPHLTLGRTKAHRGIEGLSAVLEEFKDYRAGTFPAAGLTLYRSDLRPEGSIYTKLGYFPLGG